MTHAAEKPHEPRGSGRSGWIAAGQIVSMVLVAWHRHEILQLAGKVVDLVGDVVRRILPG
jgi:hypothetical protein